MPVSPQAQRVARLGAQRRLLGTRSTGDEYLDVPSDEMTQLRRANRWFNNTASNPPIWLRWIYVPLFAAMALGLVLRRGWVIGTVAAGVCGGGGLAVALSPGGVVSWSRSHPRLDGAIFGPLLFLALAFIIPSLSVWWCLLAGVVGVFVGIALGGRRDRLRAGGTSVP